MTKFEELLAKVKGSVKKQLTSDLPTEKIDELSQISKDVDDLGSEHNKLVEEHSKLKDKYIESIQSFGSKEAPTEEQEPKSLEEIAQEVISKDKK